MSADSLRELVDTVTEQALSIAATQEHAPILITPGAITLVETHIRERGSISAALHALCAHMRPEMACFVYEGWGLRQDAPAWVRQAVLGPGGLGEGGVGIATLDRQYRDEVLTLYAEDDEGNWHSRTFVITARQRGGIAMLDDHAGGPDSTEQQGAMRGFVPRKTAV